MTGNGLGSFNTLIERWSGRAWTQVPAPALGEGRFLNAVATVSASSAWAVGINGPSRKTLIERWNGTAWKLS